MKTGKTVTRLDRGTAEILEDGAGFLRAKVSIARTGVFPYLTPEGTIRHEAMLPDDLFSEETVESAKGAPVTDGHPETKGLLTPVNWGKYTKGALGDSISISEDHLMATETIFDADLIKELKSGKKVEVSIGKTCTVEPRKGELQGVKYDAVQTNIRINHVAHVEQGREGPTVRAYLDEAEDKTLAVMIDNARRIRMDEKDKNLLQKIFDMLKSMAGSTGDGEPKTDEGTDVPAEETAPAQSENADRETRGDSAIVADLTKRINDLQARYDALAAKEKKRMDMTAQQTRKDEIDEAVARRLSLIEQAKGILPEERFDGCDDKQIQLKVISKHLPFDKEVKVDELDDNVVQARFDAAVSLAKELANVSPAGENSQDTRLDESVIAEHRAGRKNIYGKKEK